MDDSGQSRLGLTASRLPGLDAESVIVVAGGGGAIGSHLAQTLVGMGVKTAILGRSQKRLAAVQVSVENHDLLHSVVCDISRQEDCVAAIAEVERHFGSITGLVNSAAVSDAGVAFKDVSHENVDRIFGINLVGPIMLSQAVFPALERSGGGSIVHIGSVEAYRANPGKLLYGTAKAALLRIVSQLAIEGGSHGIRVNCVSAGQTPTPLLSYEAAAGAQAEQPNSGSSGVSADVVPLGRRGVLDDYVGPVLFLLSDLSSYVTGKDVPAEGGILNRRIR